MARQDIVLTAGLDVTEFNKGLNQYIRGLNQMQSESMKTAQEVQNLGNVASTSIGVAMGVAAVQGIQTVTRALGGLGKEVLTTLKFFESLQFSLETTMALNLATADSTVTMEQALTQTGDAAESYLLTLQDLAIFSPFTTEEIGAANRTLQIYGLMSDEALGLTRLITDLASVGGFGAERLQRISLATGQIFAEGRLLARDALQLTQAGVPILKFIENMTDQTTGEIQKLMRKGLLPANVAFEALVDGLQDFEGAGRRVAGTAQGLFSSLEDIRSITLRDLFKGVFEGIRPFMQELVDLTSAQEFRAAITAIGDVLGENLSRAVGNVARNIGDFIKVIRGLPKEVNAVIGVFIGATVGLTAFAAAIGLVQFALISLISPFTIVVGAVAGFAALWVAGQQRITQGSNELANQVTANTIRMARAFGGFAKVPEQAVSAITVFTDRFGRAGEFIVRVFGHIESSAADATNFILDLLSSVAEWGLNVGELFATGIAAAQNAVFGAVGVLGSVITGLLAPGSPPKLLPDIDTWGQKTAEEWLRGWTEADFDILGDIAKSVRDELRALVSREQLDEVSAARILIGSRQDIADAINQIEQLGGVTEDMMRKVRNSAGPAADEVEQLLNAYTDVTRATDEAAEAQERLTQITESYDRTLEPLRQQLERISELRRTGDEDAEIRNLRRTIANEAVGTNRKRQAQLRIEEILLGRQVRGLEKQKETAVDGAEATLEARQKDQEAAELALKLIQARISAQNQQIALYGEELKALEKLAKELDKLAKKLRDEFLKPFEDAIKKASLLAAEVKDTIALFKAQHTINDANATVAAKIAAEINQQAIAARRAKRFFELRELGVPQEEIERLREFAVELSDIGIKTKGDPKFPAVDLSAIAEDVTDRIKEFREQVAAFKDTMKDSRDEFNKWLGSINALLPTYLQFISASEQTPELFRNVGAAFAGLVAIIASNRLVSVLRALPALIFGVGTPLGFLINALGLFTAAWVADWGGIRQVTNDAIIFLQNTFESFREGGGFDQFVPQNEEFQERLAEIESSWSAFALTLQTSLQAGLSVESFQNILNGLVEAIASTASQIVNLSLFDDLADQIDSFIERISDPRQLAARFNLMFTTIRAELIAGINQLVSGGEAEESMAEFIGRSVAGAAGAFVVNIPIWISEFVNAVSIFLRGIRRSIDTMFSDFFGTILPALLFMFGRTAGALGSAVARLVLTGLDILFSVIIPELVRNLPRLLGALAAGFAAGAREAGNGFIDALIVMTAAITGFIAATMGPQIISSLNQAFGGAFRSVTRGITRDLRQIIGAILLGLRGLAQVAGVLLFRIGQDLFNVLQAPLRSILGALQSVGTRILAFFGRPLISVITRVLTIFLTGVREVVGVIGLLLQPMIGWQLALLRIEQGFEAISTQVSRLPALFQAIAAPLQRILLGIFGRFTQVIPSVITAFDRLRGTIPAVVTSIGSALGFMADQFGRLLGGFRNFGLGIGRVVSFLSSSFVTAAVGAGEALETLLFSTRGLGSGFRSLILSVGTFVRSLTVTNVLAQVSALFTQFGLFAERGVIAAGQAFRGLGAVITQALTSVRPLISSFFGTLSNLATSGFLGKITGQLSKLGPAAARAVQGLGAGLTNLVTTGALAAPGEAAAGVLSRLGSLFTGAESGRGIGRFVSNLSASFKDLNLTRTVFNLKNVGAVLGGLRSVLLGFLNPLTLVTSAIDFFAFAFNAEIEGVENGARGLVDNLRTFWSELISGQIFEDIISTAREWVSTFAEVISLITEFGFDSEEVQNRLQEIGQSIIDWIQDVGSRIWESITTFWIPVFFQWIGETITRMVEGLGTLLAAIIAWIGDVAAPFIGEKIQDWVAAFTEWWNEGDGDQKTLDTLTGILETIGTWILAAVEWLAARLAEWIPAFIGWVFQVTPPLLLALGELLLGLGAWIIESIPGIVDKLLEWATAFVSWLGPATADVIVKLGEWLGAILKWIITDAIPGIILGVVGLVVALTEWISGRSDSAESEAPNRLGEFLKAILKFFTTDILPALFQAGKSMVSAIWEGFTELWQGTAEDELPLTMQLWPEEIERGIADWFNAGVVVATELISGIVGYIVDQVFFVPNAMIKILDVLGAPDWLVQWLDASLVIGKEIMLGIAEGIVEWTFWPIQKLNEGLQSLVNAATTFLKSDSPSRLFAEEVGEPIATGIAEGIENTDTSDVLRGFERNMLDSMSNIKTGATKELSGLKTGVDKVLKDVRKNSVGETDASNAEMLESWTAMSEETQEIMLELEEFLGDVFDRVTSEMVEDVSGLDMGIIEIFTRFRNDLEIEMTTLRGNIVGEFQTMKDDSIDAVEIMVTSILNMFLYDENSLVNALSRAFIGGPDGTSATSRLGLDFVAGIAAGITSPLSYLRLFNAMKKLIDETIAAIQLEYEMGSPSEVAARMIGEPIVEGIVVGMLRTLPAVMAVVDDIATQATAGLVPRVETGLQPTPGVWNPQGVIHNQSSVRNFQLNVSGPVESQGIIRDFAVMEALG